MEYAEKVYTNKKEINKILSKLRRFSFEELIKHQHYEYSLVEKNTSESFIREIFPKFELVELIKSRKREDGKESYTLHYVLEDKTFVVIVLSFETSPPTIINAFHAKKNFNGFKKSLRKYYKPT